MTVPPPPSAVGFTPARAGTYEPSAFVEIPAGVWAVALPVRIANPRPRPIAPARMYFMRPRPLWGRPNGTSHHRPGLDQYRGIATSIFPNATRTRTVSAR